MLVDPIMSLWAESYQTMNRNRLTDELFAIMCSHIYTQSKYFHIRLFRAERNPVYSTSFKTISIFFN